jgi:pimeloyl-ACP methyl ester carboxylesterase
MLKKSLSVLCILVIAFLFSVNELYAYGIFSDDFSFQDSSKWTFKTNGGNIEFSDGVMNLSSNAYLFPYITNSEGLNLSNLGNEVIEFKFNYMYVDYMGDGIGVGYTLNGYPYYQFSIWNDLTAGPMMQYQDREVLENGKCFYNTGLKKISLAGKLGSNSWHIFKIEKQARIYKIFLDGELVFTSPNNQCIPVNLFIGNPLSGGRTWWTKLSIDYVKIFTGTYDKNKIIILPGLGASWNAQAMLLGSTVPANQWKMTPFVKNYDLLIKGLENNGLVRGQDFYVWNYDWRKPLSQIVDDFNNYVLSLGLTSGQKIDLVGHSLGGLVSRIWTQDNSSLVDHVISLGSPHYGSLNAYEAWNGAKISDNLDVASIGLNVLLQLQKKNNDTSVQTLRNYAPIVFDLSPTFTFLKRGGANVTGKFSQYLATKNELIAPIYSQLSTLDGIGTVSKEWINLGDRSLFDKVLGIWEDGRPLSYVNGVGDGTVLKKSALISGSENVDFTSNHGAIVDKSTNWVLTKLGLGITVNQNLNYPQKQAIFYSDSPVSMNVSCNGTVKNSVEGFVIMENEDSNNCQVNLVGSTEVGIYRLAVSGKDNWQYFEGSINKDQAINIVISGVDAYWQMLKQDLLNTGASNAVVAIEQKNIVLGVDEYIKFRTISKNFKNSEEILENMRYLLNLNTYTVSEINSMYSKALSGKSLVETNLRLMARNGTIPSYSSALNNEQANVLMSYGKNYAANYIAYKLYGIVWK